MRRVTIFLFVAVVGQLASACMQENKGDSYFHSYMASGWTFFGRTPTGYSIFANPISSENGSVIAWQAYYGNGQDLVTKMEWDCQNFRYRALTPTYDRLGNRDTSVDRSWIDLNNEAPGSLARAEHQDICKLWG